MQVAEKIMYAEEVAPVSREAWDRLKARVVLCPDCGVPVERIFAVHIEAGAVMYTVECHGEEFKLLGMA